MHCLNTKAFDRLNLSTETSQFTFRLCCALSGDVPLVSTEGLQPGMTLAVDGGITVKGEFGGRVGDSIVVTENGFDYLTPYPKELTVV